MGDVLYALRGLRRSPAFTAIAVVTLALGIGANTAIFSVVRAMLLAPLPYRDPSQLVFVWTDLSSGGYPRAPLSGPELKDLRDRTTRFSEFGSIWATTAALTGDGDPEQLRIGLVTTNFFSMLGAGAARGRTFALDDESQAAPRTILLSWALFQRRFGGDPGIVGKRIEVNGGPVTVVGVMPESFRLLMPMDAGVPDDLQAWMLLSPNVLTRAPRGQLYLRVVGRMKPGVTLDQARHDIDAVAAAISREYAEYGAGGRTFTTVGLEAEDARPLRPMLLALFGGVVILLAVACVNVAGLLVARAANRTRETALRMALGAGFRRLARQNLVDGFVLAALGAMAGLAVAYGGLRILLALRPASLARLGVAHVDRFALAFTIVTTAVWGLLVSLAPVAEVARTDLRVPLQQDTRRAGGGSTYRTRSVLVVLQLALSVVLLVGASLMFRTFMAILAVDPGFRADRMLTFKVSVPFNRYRSDTAFNAFTRRLQEELAALPDVKGVGSVSHVPYDNVPNWGGPYITVRGADDSKAPFADNRAVSPGYFEAAGVRLIEGRTFMEADDPHAQPVVIVDEQLARAAWPGQSAVGREIASDPFSTGHGQYWATVVGVVAHVRHRSLLEDLGPQVYFAERQILRNPLAYEIRTTGDASALAPAVRRVVHSLDPALPIFDLRPLADYVSDARSAQRFGAILAITFAGVALLLASVGVYGVIAYATARRRYEFGVRLALGARPPEVVRLVLRDGLRLTVIGVGLGALAALGLARALRSQLFGVAPNDLVSYAVTVVVVTVAALAASWLPARRASATTPLAAMHTD